MSLRDLTLSQSSLSDFSECARRFQLRYVDRVVWPAVQVEPLVEHERYLERGARFHKLIERHQLGIPESVLTSSVTDPELLDWWRAYLNYREFHAAPGERFAEFVLSAEVSDTRFVAKYDSLRVEPETRAVIVDWKTYSRAPSRDRLSARVQTHVYPYVLVASGRFPWLKPEMVSMVYWIAGASSSLVEFPYDESLYQRDRDFLATFVERIGQFMGDSMWPLTENEVACRFCHYRSLCGRGIAAGQVNEVAIDLSDFDDFDGADVVGWFDSVEDVGF